MNMPRTTEAAHEPGGTFSRECPECGIVFRTDNERIVYCSPECKKKAQNRRYYERHAAQQRERMKQYQREKRSG